MQRSRAMVPPVLFAASVALLSLFAPVRPAQTQTETARPAAKKAAGMSREQASTFARLALAGIQKEFPNKLGHVMNVEADVKRPRALHPAFYGCFDWHSAVHSHWMLVRLLRTF